MSSSNFSSPLADIFRILADEVEANQTLARKLALPLKELLAREAAGAKPPTAKTRKKSTAASVPQGFDPFQTYHETGSVGLYAELEKLDVPECKAVLGHFALDPSRSYSRLRKKEKLVDLIVQRVKAMTAKGEAFR